MKYFLALFVISSLLFSEERSYYVAHTQSYTDGGSIGFILIDDNGKDIIRGFIHMPRGKFNGIYLGNNWIDKDSKIVENSIGYTDFLLSASIKGQKKLNFDVLADKVYGNKGVETEPVYETIKRSGADKFEIMAFDLYSISKYVKSIK
jgi:hypothetical protein